MNSDESLAEALRKIDCSPFEELPVVDARLGGKVIGILTQRDISAAYNRAIVARTLRP